MRSFVGLCVKQPFCFSISIPFPYRTQLSKKFHSWASYLFFWLLFSLSLKCMCVCGRARGRGFPAPLWSKMRPQISPGCQAFPLLLKRKVTSPSLQEDPSWGGFSVVLPQSKATSLQLMLCRGNQPHLALRIRRNGGKRHFISTNPPDPPEKGVAER